MSLVVNQENSWGQAAERFADAVRYRTQGRILIKNYFNGQLFAGQQTTEFALLQQGVADFDHQLVSANKRTEPVLLAFYVPEL